MHFDINWVTKAVSAGMILTTVIVGFTTIHHGDLSLGLLVLLGQLQAHLPFGAHGGHGAHDASHLLVHKTGEVKKHG